jgi:hypothetical protein
LSDLIAVVQNLSAIVIGIHVRLLSKSGHWTAPEWPSSSQICGHETSHDVYFLLRKASTTNAVALHASEEQRLPSSSVAFRVAMKLVKAPYHVTCIHSHFSLSTKLGLPEFVLPTRIVLRFIQPFGSCRRSVGNKIGDIIFPPTWHCIIIIFVER